MRSMKERTLEEDGTTGGQKPSFPAPFLSCAGKGSLARNGEPLKEWLWDFRACGISGAHSMVNSRQCGSSAMTGTCPCQLLSEVLQSLCLLRGLPSLLMAKVLPSVKKGFRHTTWSLLWRNILPCTQGSAVFTSVCWIHGLEIHQAERSVCLHWGTHLGRTAIGAHKRLAAYNKQAPASRYVDGWSLTSFWDASRW